MAQLIKRPSSKFYYARFQVNGKDRWLSTGETDSKKARKQLLLLQAQARNEISIEEQLTILMDLINALPLDQQAARRQEVVRAVLQSQEKKLALNQAWEKWLANPNKQYDPKPKTLLGYEAIWKRFQKWAVEHKFQFIHEIEHGDVEKYAADLWQSKVSASTYNQHIKFLRALFSVLEIDAGLVTNPWSRITATKKQASGGRRNLTLDELTAVIAKAEGNLRHMIILGVFTGLRLSDVANLKVENIENNPYPPDTGPRPGFLVVKPKKTERVNKVIEVPLHAAVIDVLRKLTRGRKDGFLFPKEQAEHTTDLSRLSNRIQALFESCGIKTTEEVGESHRRRATVRVGFHSLRHTFVTLCAKAGAPLHIVQKLVGHGNPMLTGDKYLHIDKAEKQAAIENLPSLGLAQNQTAASTKKPNGSAAGTTVAAKAQRTLDCFS
jgi:integrase